jgi:hypothetical protein
MAHSRWREQHVMIEPIDTVKRRECDGLQMAPRAEPENDFRFEQANHGLGEGVVVRIAATADGGRDVGVSKAVGLVHRQVRCPAITVMHEAAGGLVHRS